MKKFYQPGSLTRNGGQTDLYLSASLCKGHWANIESQYSELLENNNNEGYWQIKKKAHIFLSCSVSTYYKFSIMANFYDNKNNTFSLHKNLENSENYGEENLNYS